jgi:hypothetical protein
MLRNRFGNRPGALPCVLAIWLLLQVVPSLIAQTAGMGVLTGSVVDSSGTNCILDNRPPSRGSRPVSKHMSSFHAVFQARNKTFLSLRQIGCQQERKQMHTIHVFCEHSAKLDPRCIRSRCLSRDRRSSRHGQLCPLRSPLPLSVNQASASRAQMLKQFVAHVGPELFATLKKASRAIC